MDTNYINNLSPYLGWHIENTIKQKGTTRIKYNTSYYKFAKLIAIDGKINKGKSYPIVLDTGSAQPNIINDIHVRKNKLAFYQFNADYGGWGMCYLPELSFGKTSLINFPTIYHGIHMQIEFFGIPIYRDETIIMGLPALLEFKYIMFDGLNKEVEVSASESFRLGSSDEWYEYHIRVDNNLTKEGPTLLVKLPVEKINTEFVFDTGFGGGLILSQEQLGEISKSIPEIRLQNGALFFPAHDAPININQGIVPELSLGDRVVNNVPINVISEGNSILRNKKGLLGMQCFQSTVVVLDFENNVMWVKK